MRVGESDTPLSIVCGAANIAVGQRVPVALPGAVLPGGRRIGVTSIQGTESQGMLCSGAELGLTTDAEGILILSGDTAGGGLDGLTLGRPLSELAGNTVLDIDVKPNRGDALSLIGLAREVAAITGGAVRWPEISVPETGDSTDDHVWVEIADRRLCPRFVGRYVDGLKLGPSPLPIQLRLAAAGMRPISNVVDASNYVMLELGKPIHVFDAAAVAGGVIVVRPAHDGELLETLDHVERRLTPETLVIADSGGPIGIAGVMGGAHSEVAPGTVAAIIESAVFDPVSVRRTAQRYGLRSEASARFEKGQELRLARVGADRTAQLLAEWASARVAVGVVDTNPVDEQPRRVVFRPARVSRLLGEQIEADEMSAALARVGIATEPVGVADWLTLIEGEPLSISADTGRALAAVVPPHRRDIVVEADVAEEICRLRGYENLAPRLPDTAMPGYRRDPSRPADALREMLCGRGLAEVVTNGLIDPLEHVRLGYAPSDEATIVVANPVTVEHSELRRSLLPGLVGVLARNERQRRADVAIFELGAIHERRGGEPAQSDQLAILLSGNWRTPSWAEPAREAAVEDVKGLVEALTARLNLARPGYRPTLALAGVEHPGRTATIEVVVDGRAVELGRIAELDPRYLEAYEIRAERAVVALLDVAALFGLAGGTPQVRRIDHLPALERDLAVVVGRDTAAADVESVIRRHGGPFLESLALFDRYSGPPLEADQVSLAYRLRYQPAEEPLSESALEESIEAITNALAREVGGRVRSG